MSAFALIIGVDDYTAYNPSGGSDLQGAVNDAAAWLKTAQALGIPAKQIRVLTSRAIPGQTGGATRAEIVAGLEWIRDALKGPDHTKALICFSGHGAWDPEEGSLLCPSDVTQDGVRVGGALSAKAMYAILDQRPQLDRHRNAITLFIDACDAGGGGEKKATGRGLPSPAGNRTGTPTFFNTLNTDLLLAASAPGAESFEVPTTDGVRGAFSFAANAVLARWGTVDDTDGKAFNLTYGDLAERINYITGALDVDQRAHFDSAAIQKSRRVFSEERDTMRGLPPVPHPLFGREISPGATDHEINQYQVLNNSGTVVANLYVPADKPPKDWSANTVYWQKVDTYASFYDLEQAMSGGDKLTISFNGETTGGGKNTNPLAPLKGSDCESSYDTGTFSTTTTTPGSNPLTFNMVGYVNISSSALNWFVPGHVVSSNLASLEITKPTTAASNLGLTIWRPTTRCRPDATGADAPGEIPAS